MGIGGAVSKHSHDSLSSRFAMCFRHVRSLVGKRLWAQCGIQIPSLRSSVQDAGPASFSSFARTLLNTVQEVLSCSGSGPAPDSETLLTV